MKEIRTQKPVISMKSYWTFRNTMFSMVCNDQVKHERITSRSTLAVLRQWNSYQSYQ